MNKIPVFLLVVMVIIVIGVAVLSSITRNGLADIQADLNGAQSRIDSLSSRNDQIMGELTNIKNDLNNLKSGLDEVRSEISTLANQYDQTTNDITNIRNDILIAIKRLSYLEGETGILPSDKTETLRPVGPGSESFIDTQYPITGSHWDKLDDVTPDEDASFVENKNGPVDNFQRDLFAIQNHTTGSGLISSVNIIIRTKNNAPGHPIGVSLKTYDVVYDYDLGGGKSEYYDDFWELILNPYTKLPWTWEEVDDMEAGLTLGGSTYSPDWSRCTQLYVAVFYE